MVARYYKELVSYFSRTVKGREEASDLVQEAYVRVLSLQQSGQAIREPRALLYRTARNVLIDRYRRDTVRGEACTQDADDICVESMPAPVTSEPEASLMSAQGTQALLRTIEALPLRCREAFMLHKFDGLSHAEVATQMGISRKAVEQHIALALRACRQCRDAPSSARTGSTPMSGHTHPVGGNTMDIALDWFVRERGGLDAADAQEYHQWLQAHPEHQAAFEHWQTEWSALDALPAASVQALRNSITKDKRAARATTPGFWRTWWDGLAMGSPVAAFASLVLVVGAGWLGWTAWSNHAVFEQTFASQRGQQLDVNLPDASRVRLDTGTRIEVAYFAKRREVHLTEGQAMFQVQPDADKPFDVLAGPVRITVVGTRFSVRYTPTLPGASGVQVSVESGRVRVVQAVEHGERSAHGGEATELEAGQQLVASADGRLGPTTRVSPSDVAPWRQSRVSFDDRPLAEVLAEFERYGATHFLIADPAVGALTISGTFDPRRLDNFARVLPQALPVRLRRTGDVTEIIAK